MPVYDKDQKYKIVRVTGTNRKQSKDEWRLSRAEEMKTKYGLFHLSVEDVQLTWSEYSGDIANGWLIDDKKSIEYAFGVILEPITNAS